MTLILTTIRYGFSWIRMNYYGGMAKFSYRTAFIAAAVTYGIVVYKTQRARAKTGTRAPGGAIGIFADENVQYLRASPAVLNAPNFVLTTPSLQFWPLSGSSSLSTRLPSSRTRFTPSSTSQHTRGARCSLSSSRLLPVPMLPLLSGLAAPWPTALELS